jgi:poly-gamma-glutamate synthesis protein (capsule biosynthesis protein)
VKATPSGIVTLEGNEKKQVLKQMAQRTKEIQQEGFIKNSWSTFCKAKKALYIPLLFGLGRIPIHTNRLLNNKLIRFLYSTKRVRTALNIVRCESHKEVIQTILEKETN